MPRAKVLVCDPISDEAIRLLRESEKVQVVNSPAITQGELLETAGEYDAFIVRSRTKITKQVIEKAVRLKVIGRAGVGVDNIDSEAAAERKVKILNTPDALTNAVAEFTVGLMLCLARKIPQAHDSLRNGQWLKSSFHGTELSGSTYGTIGIGRIGRRVAALSSAFGMKIIANDVIPVPPDLIERYNIEVSSQEEVFERADFVDLHVPLTPETTHLVNYDKLRKMKRSAYLINTARGKVVDENALVKALNENLIAGAALDVFEVEPPTRNELLKSDKVILTPHIAGQTIESQLKAGTQIAELVLNAFD